MKPRKYGINNNKKIIIVLIGFVLVITLIVWRFSSLNKKGSVEDKNLNTNGVSGKNVGTTKNVLIAIKNMSAGDFSPDDFKQIDVDTSIKLVPVDAIENMDDLKDKKLRSNIKENEILQSSKLIEKNLWYEAGDRLVEINFVEGAIPTIILRDQLIGTLVDVILFKKGAIDEIVVTKVAIVAADGNKLGFYLNPEERENLKESVTEQDGLYLVAYLDETQKPSNVTYQPSYEKGEIVDETR